MLREQKRQGRGEREEMLPGKPQGSFLSSPPPPPPSSIFFALNFPCSQTSKNAQTETVATCMHAICDIDLGFEKRFSVV